MAAPTLAGAYQLGAARAGGDAAGITWLVGVGLATCCVVALSSRVSSTAGAADIPPPGRREDLESEADGSIDALMSEVTSVTLMRRRAYVESLLEDALASG